MNNHKVEGELASKVIPRPAGNGTIHHFRVMTEELNYKGDKVLEEHVFETFNEDAIESLRGVGLGAHVRVHFKLSSRPWKDRHFTSCRPTHIEVLEMGQGQSATSAPSATDDIPF